jgi:hypothetical protein
MKILGYILLVCALTMCTTPVASIKEKIEFDWMPEPITWQNNIRNCRSQPQCNAADLFNRHGI